MGIVTNRIDELATSALADWTEVSQGAGPPAIRVGIKLPSANKSLYYSQDFAGLDNGNAFIDTNVFGIM